MPAALSACKTTYNLEECFTFLYMEPVETNKQIGFQSKLYVFVDYFIVQTCYTFQPFLIRPSSGTGPKLQSKQALYIYLFV
jgi:hypothetical protein